MMLTIRDTKLTNREVKITKEYAMKLGEEYLKRSVATGIKSVELGIVRPNLLFREEKGKIYKHINEMRKAYIVKFDNKSKSEVYIDATTGEFIGGAYTLGGEF